MENSRDAHPTDILRSASEPYPHPDLDALLTMFRKRFHSVVAGRFPILRDRCDDLVQQALLALVSPAKLGTLRDPSRLDTWALAILLNLCRSELRRSDRERWRRLDLPHGAACTHALLRRHADAAPGRSPEDIIASREVIRAILAAVEPCPVARLAWIDELSEGEIIARLSLRTRAQVAGRLKRLRVQIRRNLIADSGGPVRGH